MPSSFITSTTSGWTRSPGVVPAERAPWRPWAARSKSAWLICERPAVWRQTKSAFAIRSLLREGREGNADHVEAPLEATDREVADLLRARPEGVPVGPF